jgi:hypothetical protein
MVVEDGEWMQPATPLTERHVAFEVHLPELVRYRMLKTLPSMMTFSGRQPAVTAQDSGHRAGTRHFGMPLCPQPRSQLPSTPGGVLITQRQHQRFHLRRGLVRRDVRPSGTIDETGCALLHSAIQPLVAGGRGNTKTTAESSNWETGICKGHKFSPLVHPRHLRPRQRALPFPGGCHD